MIGRGGEVERYSMGKKGGIVTCLKKEKKKEMRQARISRSELNQQLQQK